MNSRFAGRIAPFFWLTGLVSLATTTLILLTLLLIAETRGTAAVSPLLIGKNVFEWPDITMWLGLYTGLAFTLGTVLRKQYSAPLAVVSLHVLAGVTLLYLMMFTALGDRPLHLRLGAGWSLTFILVSVLSISTRYTTGAPRFAWRWGAVLGLIVLIAGLPLWSWLETMFTHLSWGDAWGVTLGWESASVIIALVYWGFVVGFTRGLRFLAEHIKLGRRAFLIPEVGGQAKG